MAEAAENKRKAASPLPPGSVIGVLGGGQLGRMLALAAARLGYRVHVYCPQSDSPAAQVTSVSTTAAYDDEAALARFAEAIDVVTYEFENIPLATAQFLAEHRAVRPSPRILEIAQDRIAEKDYLRSIDIPTARYVEVTDVNALARGLGSIGTPSVLKSARLGYDGKGQVAIGSATDPAAAWAEMGADRGILEGFVDFRLEISVIVARAVDGATMTYPAVENLHKNHILDTTIAPARVTKDLADKAETYARHIAASLDLAGLMAVEMFVAGDRGILVNELAPRPHNSGHWTIDACATSQFEQAVRAVCGLPLGSVERHADAVMKNLLGEDVSQWRAILGEPAAKLHLYGKAEARPGRKMGHVTRLTPKA
jgi:5-(carboxyamino)imidazole ribonucleotide synthase